MTTHRPTEALSDGQYHALTSEVLSRVEAQVDEWLQADVVDIDSSRTGGLLEMSFPNGSKLILNTQPPLQELWLAAKAGGFHFRYAGGRWVDTKDGRELFTALSECATAQAALTLTFTP